jgi:hypothetical protein
MQEAEHADLVDDDIEKSINCMTRALELLSSVCGPYNQQIYYCNGKLFTIFLRDGMKTDIMRDPPQLWLTGRIDRAVRVCSHIVSYLLVSLSCCAPNHPLLGLQLLTLGSIYDLL